MSINTPPPEPLYSQVLKVQGDIQDIAGSVTSAIEERERIAGEIGKRAVFWSSQE